MRSSPRMDRQDTTTRLLGLFGLVGLLIAAVGLYGTTNYIVSQRTREFGVRIAVGADRRRIVALVLRQGLVLAGGGGVLLGAVIALPLALVLSRSVFGAGRGSVGVFALAAALLAAVAILPSVFSARRAARTDPVKALQVS